MIAATWTDMIVGVDIHWVMVPAPPSPAPIPTPLPHPFTGVVYDPVGLAVGTAISAGIALATGQPITGPVLVNNLPAANTGTEGTNKMVMPHFPTPPGVAWAPVPAGLKPPIPGQTPDPGVPTPVPSNDGIIVTGSKTVYINGSNASRLGDLVMSCGEPIRLPSSTIIAVPKGAPVLVGGPMALDFMAAALAGIRTSWVSDRLRGLVNRALGEGSRAARWINKAICFFTGHPVDVASGMVMTDAVDFEIPGADPLRFERTYYSRSEYSGPLGNGWGHSFDQWLQIEDGAGIYHDGDGREIRFRAPGTRESTLIPSEGLEIWNEGSRFRITRRDGRALAFVPDAGSGRYWLSAMGRSGVWTHRLRRDPSDRLSELTADDGATFRFESDAGGRIRRILGPVEPTGGEGRLVEFEYDESGNLVRAVDAMGGSMTYAYVGSLLVSEWDRCGLGFHFSYDGRDPSARCIRTWGDGGIYDHELHYDLAGGKTVVVDSLGMATVYEWDEAGRVVRIEDPLGTSEAFGWNDEGLLASAEDASGGVESWEYSERGDVTRLARPDGASVRLEYDEDGVNTRYVREDGGWIAVERGRNGDCRLETSWGAVGLVRLDPAERPMHAVNAQGISQWFERGETGRASQVRDAYGPVARLEWTATGRLASIEDPAGSFGSFDYDVLGRPIRIASRSSGATDLEYDAEGNVVRVTWGGRPLVELEYGFRNKVTRRRIAGGPEIRYSYDTEGRPLQIRTSDDRICSFEHNGAGRVVQEETLVGTTLEYSYEGGRVAKILETGTGGEGRRRVGLGRDESGRIVSRSVQGGPAQEFEYDVFGRPVRVAEGDHEIRLAYDDYGNLVAERHADFEVAHEYDRRGKRVRRRSSSGWVCESAYDLRGRLVALYCGRSSDPPQVTTFVYGASGKLDEVRYQGGARSTFRYDATGRLIEEGDEWRGGRRRRRYSWDSRGRVRRWEDSETGELRFAYGPGGHLVDVVGEETAWSVAYDEDGRMVRLDGHDVRRDAHGRLVQVGETEYRYDSLARVAVRITGAGAMESRLEFDGLHRLRKVETDAGEATFRYDAFGRLVARTVGDRELRLRWDGGALMERLEAEGTVQHFLQDWSRPLLVGTSQGVSAFRLDWRGVPVATFDGGGRRTWASEPWLDGGQPETRPDQPFGWPGQLWDEATGLWYNGARWFDQKTWQYLSPDPLGLEGGTEPYDYVRDPNTECDPLGLILGVDQEPGGYNGYPPPDFRDTLDEYRSQRGIKNSRNIAILELKDGTREVFVSGRAGEPQVRGSGGHSERQMLQWMDENGVRASQVRRIYTEMSPCHRIGGCLDALRRRFQHLKTRIPVTFSFPWMGDQFDSARHRAIEDFKATCS